MDGGNRSAHRHRFRGFLPGDDRSVGALVLHVLEEMFGHREGRGSMPWSWVRQTT